MKNSLRQIRKKAGLSLDKLAKKAGVGLSTIGFVETGKLEPSEDFLRKVSEALGVTVEEILRLSIENNHTAPDYMVEETSYSRPGSGMEKRLSRRIAMAARLRMRAKVLKDAANELEREATELENERE